MSKKDKNMTTFLQIKKFETKYTFVVANKKYLYIFALYLEKKVANTKYQILENYGRLKLIFVFAARGVFFPFYD